MQRFQKIIIALGVITVLVIVFSIISSYFVRPNQKTQLSAVIPDINGGESEKLLDDQKNNYVIAAWIWKYPEDILKDFDNMIKFAKKEDINTLYVYIDNYVDIYELPESAEKIEKMNKYENSLQGVVQKAKKENISVQALSGFTAYSYDSHSYIPPIVVDHVFEFNQKHPNDKLDGIQFDIEFYEDSRFFGSQEEYVQSYLQLVSDMAKRVKNLNDQYQDNVQLGFVIPFWFDEVNEYLSKPIIKNLVTDLSVAQHPYLVIMAYRNIIEGDKGVLEISGSELQAANNTPVKIIIAQELVENKDTKITHFGESRVDIKKAFLKIIEGAKSNPSFAGISIHDLETFMKTK
ncbi:MAG TPA: hypothetical protein VI819_00550 [Patescibacteria group bacterium]|nr:hypothetical protein [Patescibacteria group bacterium]